MKALSWQRSAKGKLVQDYSDRQCLNPAHSTAQKSCYQECHEHLRIAECLVVSPSVAPELKHGVWLE